MSKKIAKVDAEVMNSLYAAEIAKVGKIAADALTDDKGAPKDPQAFTDHEEYIANLKSAMSDDKNVEGAGNPNDVLVD